MVKCHNFCYIITSECAKIDKTTWYQTSQVTWDQVCLKFFTSITSAVSHLISWHHTPFTLLDLYLPTYSPTDVDDIFVKFPQLAFLKFGKQHCSCLRGVQEAAFG